MASTRCVSLWAALVLAFSFMSSTSLAAPQIRCSVAESSVVIRAGLEDRITGDSVFGEGCDDEDVAAFVSSTTTTTFVDSTTDSERSIFKPVCLSVVHTSLCSATTTVRTTGERRVRASLPFRVPGGDDEEGDASIVVKAANRPAGSWAVLIDAKIEETAHEAWLIMRNFGYDGYPSLLDSMTAVV